MSLVSMQLSIWQTVIFRYRLLYFKVNYINIHFVQIILNSFVFSVAQHSIPVQCVIELVQISLANMQLDCQCFRKT